MEQSDFYWFIRDVPIALKAWAKLHARASIADARIALSRANNMPGLLPNRQFIESTIIDTWWSHQLPPLYPFYSWSVERNRKSDFTIDKNLRKRINIFKQNGYVLMLPLLMASYGDFLAEIKGDERGALHWYKEAMSLCNKYEWDGPGQLVGRCKKKHGLM